MGYYDIAYDTKIDLFFSKHNIGFTIDNGPFTLTFPNTKQELLFRLT